MGIISQRRRRTSFSSTMAHKWDAEALFGSDEQIAGKKAEPEKYAKLADQAAVDRAVEALKTKHAAAVHVVDSREAALKALLATIPAGATISAAGSHPLSSIGYDEWAKG